MLLFIAAGITIASIIQKSSKNVKANKHNKPILMTYNCEAIFMLIQRKYPEKTREDLIRSFEDGSLSDLVESLKS